MMPLGNFGFGLGLGWIAVGIIAFVMVLGIFQLVRFSFKDDRETAEEEAALAKLKEDVCSREMTPAEFERRIHDIA